MPHPVMQFQITPEQPDETARFYSELFGWTIDADKPWDTAAEGLAATVLIPPAVMHDTSGMSFVVWRRP